MSDCAQSLSEIQLPNRYNQTRQWMPNMPFHPADCSVSWNFLQNFGTTLRYALITNTIAANRLSAAMPRGCGK